MFACDRKVLDPGSCTGPDRSRKLHETIAASSHRFPFLAVRSSRPAWLLTWCGPRQLPHGHISPRVEKNSYFKNSFSCAPFLFVFRAVATGFWLYYRTPFVLYLTHTRAVWKWLKQKLFPVLSGVSTEPANQITFATMFLYSQVNYQHLSLLCFNQPSCNPLTCRAQIIHWFITQCHCCTSSW